MDKKKIIEILDKNINQEQILKDICLEMILPKLDEVVAKSETKIDDAAWALAKEIILKAVNA